MQPFIEFVVRALVDRPDAVEITETVGERETIYRVSLHRDDIGLVIGKGGRTIGSIRSVLNTGLTSGKHLAVEVVENTAFTS